MMPIRAFKSFNRHFSVEPWLSPALLLLVLCITASASGGGFGRPQSKASLETFRAMLDTAQSISLMCTITRPSGPGKSDRSVADILIEKPSRWYLKLRRGKSIVGEVILDGNSGYLYSRPSAAYVVLDPDDVQALLRPAGMIGGRGPYPSLESKLHLFGRDEAAVIDGLRLASFFGPESASDGASDGADRDDRKTVHEHGKTLCRILVRRKASTDGSKPGDLPSAGMVFLLDLDSVSMAPVRFAQGIEMFGRTAYIQTITFDRFRTSPSRLNSPVFGWTPPVSAHRVD